jgi:hypothetical protein
MQRIERRQSINNQTPSVDNELHQVSAAFVTRCRKRASDKRSHREKRARRGADARPRERRLATVRRCLSLARGGRPPAVVDVC